MSDNSKIKVAFVKFCGCASGGTERFVQEIAAGLPKDKFDVDFYYCDSAPYVGNDFKHPDTEQSRVKYLEKNGVNLVKFHVGAKDITKPHHPWLDTDFFHLFDESKYDIIQTGRAGHAEFPFTEIHKTPIVDALTLPNHAERKPNVEKVIHISQYQADTWIQSGGEPHKIEIIPIFENMPKPSGKSLRSELNIPEDAFVFGMHQRVEDGIFSPACLEAYKTLMNDNTYMVIMGGSKLYSEYAEKNELKNFIQLPHASDDKTRDKFLATLNVYTHARADGETFSKAIAEALYYGLPIVSHVAPAMGHVETIGPAGVVANDMSQYIEEMKKLYSDKEYYSFRSKNAKKQYDENFDANTNIEKIIKIYESVYLNNQTVSADDDWLNEWMDE